MLKIILEKWEKNKDKLKKIFETEKGFNSYDCNYRDIVELTFEVIYNTDEDSRLGRVNTERITEINDGDYQGTLLYLIPFDSYQPNENEYLMTYVDYGSCSGCDTLQSLQSYGDDVTETQVNGFMTLAKDILQNTIKPYNYGWRNDGKFERAEVDDD